MYDLDCFENLEVIFKIFAGYVFGVLVVECGSWSYISFMFFFSILAFLFVFFRFRIVGIGFVCGGYKRFFFLVVWRKVVIFG